MGCGASAKKYEEKKDTKPDEKDEATKKDGAQPGETSAKPAGDTKPAGDANKDAATTPTVQAEPVPMKALGAAPKKVSVGAADAEEEDEDEDDEIGEEEGEEMIRKSSMNIFRKREGVMAETFKPDDSWVPPVNPKTDEQRKRIESALSRPAAFMFHSLEATERETLILAFKEHDLEAGADVIKQGVNVTPDEPGLYVIESGDLDVYKSNGAEGEDARGPKVFTYKGAGQFGELALLYNAPRAATVVTATKCVLWSIDRNTFNALVKDATQKRAEKYEAFLAEVEVLKALKAEERSKIADVLKVKNFNEGENIILEQEEGEEFYILEEGKAVATKEGKVVKEYNPKDYFGELALISASARRATVTAKETPTKVLALERAAFNRLLGSLESKMKENAEAHYEGVTLA